MIRPRFILRYSCARIVCIALTASVLFLSACGTSSSPTTPAATATTPVNANTRPGFIATLVPLTQSSDAPSGTAGTNATGAAFPTSTASRGAIASSSATTTGSRTWSDPVNGIQLQYPAVWKATPAATANDDDLRLDGPGNQTIFVDISAPDANGPAPTSDEALQMIRDAQARSMQYTYTYGMEQDTKVGGEPAKYLEYRYSPRANQTAPPAQGAIWVVQRGDRTYVLRASNIGAGRTDVDTIIGSVSYSTPATPPSGSPMATTATSATAGTNSATPTAPLVRGTASSVASSTAPSSPAPAPTATP